MKFKLFSRSYLSWDEYSKKISDIDNINFINSTAIMSYKNLLRRESLGGG